MLAFKPDVRLDCSSPAITHILYHLAKTAKELELTIRITSGNDSHHLGESKHYTNQAIDIGTHEFSDKMKDNLFDTLYTKFFPKFTVLFENRNTENEHIHIQVKKGTSYP